MKPIYYLAPACPNARKAFEIKGRMKPALAIYDEKGTPLFETASRERIQTIAMTIQMFCFFTEERSTLRSIINRIRVMGTEPCTKKRGAR